MIRVKLKKKKIVTYLAKKNLSQNWLAKRLGVSSAYISQLMSGKRMPSPEMRKRIQNYFEHLTFDELFKILE